MARLNHIHVINVSSVDDREVAFWIEAARIQLVECAASWGLPPSGIALYPKDSTIPVSEGMVLVVADDDGNADSLGYHAIIANVPYAIIGARETYTPSVVFSHEALEAFLNLHLDVWLPAPDGSRHAREACDAVQADTYSIRVKLFEQERIVQVSAWLRPAWFGIGDGECAVGRPGLNPFEISRGGYSITLVNGRIVELYGSEPQPHRFLSSRQLRRTGRMRQLVEAGERLLAAERQAA